MNTPELKPDAATEMTKIAHYKIIGKLGQGGMSVVYEAIDERLKRPVAIKMLHPFLAATQEYRKRFFREAEAVARLDHPNIVQIFDVANPQKNPEQLYIVTELLVGKTLRDFIKETSLVELPELSAMIIWQIALALEHAHQKGIIHRDIKPENIMIKSDGQIKLMDFGIASIGNEEGLTQAGTLLGSLAHLAPEVITGQKITAQSDIFSLSTVFYWLLSNTLPFVEDSPHALLKAIVDKRAKRIQQISPFVLDDLALIVEKGMAKNSKDRFKSAQQMSEAIESFLSDEGLAVDVKQMTRTLRSPTIELPLFKQLILAQIHKKATSYRELHNQAKALALQCRLDTNFASPKIKPKRISFQTTFAAILLGLFLTSLLFFAKERPQETQSYKIMPVPKKDVDQQQSIDNNLDPPMATKEDPPAPKDMVKTKPPDKIADVQTIHLIIWPFATVIINGQTMATDTKSLTVKLAKGTHRLEFVHDYAATVEKKLHIKDIENPVEIKINLDKSKPAFLVINSTIEADVAVAGHYKGSSKNSVLRPMVIPIPDRNHSLRAEVIIKRDGYQTQMHEVAFIAGKTSFLTVTLEALAEANSSFNEKGLP